MGFWEVFWKVYFHPRLWGHPVILGLIIIHLVCTFAIENFSWYRFILGFVLLAAFLWVQTFFVVWGCKIEHDRENRRAER